jgi:glycosyltransferase involved in cell wall biosynthesis
MRILWLSNAPWVGSGYGEQTALFVPRLAGQGHEMAIFANYGLQDSLLGWDGYPVYPTDNDYGNRALPFYLDDFKADQVIALCDAWVLKPDEWPDGPPVAVWAPIDHTPIPSIVLPVLAHKRIQPIAMSRFGERMMRQAALDPLYVPHGIDTTIFRPHPEARDLARDELGVPRDAFLVGMVAANVGDPNMSRKSFAEAFAGFGRLALNHPDAWLYVHSNGNPRPGAGGLNLYNLATRKGLPQERMRIPSDEAWWRGIPHDFLALAYQAMDCLLMPSMGEGFGVPLIEAAACGVPVIASDHSAMTELCEAGWLVQGQPRDHPGQEADFFTPFIHSIAECLEAAYDARGDRRLRDAAARFALEYDADLVADSYWRPALEQLTTPRLNRAQRRAKVRA